MTEGADHPRDALHDLVDGRLEAGSLAEVEAHVRSCASCLREVEVLRATKQKVANVYRSASAPQVLEALERRVIAALDEEDRTHGWARGEPAGRISPPRKTSDWSALRAVLAEVNHLWRRPSRSVGALVAVAAVAVIAVFLHFRRGDLPTSVAQGYDEARSGRLVLDRKTADPRELAAHFAERLSFKPGVFDLEVMRYRLVGGVVHFVGGRPSSLAVYEGPDGRTVTCDMYEGRLSDLPPPTAVVENNGRAFRIYEMKGHTLVFWADGGVICVLTSDMPSTEVIPLAFAEAAKA